MVTGEEVLVGWVGAPVEDREAFPAGVRVVGRAATSEEGHLGALLAVVVGASSWVANRVVDLCDNNTGTAQSIVILSFTLEKSGYILSTNFKISGFPKLVFGT